MPVLVVVAGPNGSGKSTLTARTRLQRVATLIDPDAIARRLDPDLPSRAAIQAGREAILQSRSCIADRRRFAVETTLAGHGPVATIREALAAAFKTYVLYVGLGDPELQMERVRLRVLKGGHDVPDDDIRRRYVRSLDRVPEALTIAHRGTVVDNSGSAPRRMLTVRRGQIIWRAAALPQWVEDIVGKLDNHSG